MYIFKNAIENIARNKGRNILMGAIIFAIIATTVVALIINNTASAVIESYKDRFSSEVSIAPDMNALREQSQNLEGGRSIMRIMAPPAIEAEQLMQFANSEYLKETIAYVSIGATSTNEEIRAIDQQDDTDDTEDNADSNVYSRSGSVNINMGGMVRSAIGMSGNYRIYGDYWKDFNDDYRFLESGEMPQNDGECIISEELAELNNISIGNILTFASELSMDYDIEAEEYSELEIGDTIILNDTEYTVAESFMGGRATREVTYQLKVVGIYADLTDEYPNEYISQMASMNRRNEILTTFNTVLSERKTDESGATVNVTYYLKNPDYLADFEAEVRAKGLSDEYAVSVDTASYMRIVKPVEGLKGISIAFMLIVLVLGGIILALLSTMVIRERKYEIGVLRAMGMKKSKVALGLLTEMVVLTCVCLIIGLSVGAIVAQPVTDSLLQIQIEAEGQNNQNMMNGGSVQVMGGARIGGSPMMINGANANVQPLSEMKINIGFDTVVQIILISLLLASLAGLTSISKITKYEPIKILMERN